MAGPISTAVERRAVGIRTALDTRAGHQGKENLKGPFLTGENKKIVPGEGEEGACWLIGMGQETGTDGFY